MSPGRNYVKSLCYQNHATATRVRRVECFRRQIFLYNHTVTCAYNLIDALRVRVRHDRVSSPQSVCRRRRPSTPETSVSVLNRISHNRMNVFSFRVFHLPSWARHRHDVYGCVDEHAPTPSRCSCSTDVRPGNSAIVTSATDRLIRYDFRFHYRTNYIGFVNDLFTDTANRAWDQWLIHRGGGR